MSTQLILGGARSGKSRHAQQLAEASKLAVSIIVTAEAHDAEMAQRIAVHQAERPANWRVIEAPFDLSGAIRHACAPDRCVLIDCVTLWLSNLMCQRPEQLHAACDALLETVAEINEQHFGPLLIVSNEVGWSIVPDSALGRAFRDEAGRLNQGLAAACKQVTLVVAGLPMKLK